MSDTHCDSRKMLPSDLHLSEYPNLPRSHHQLLRVGVGLQRNVQLYFSKQIDIPATIGFLKPIVLLPATAVTHLTAAQLEAVLLHELAHIKRQDYRYRISNRRRPMVFYFYN